MILNIILLLNAVIIVFYCLRDRDEYRRFKLLESTEERRRYFCLWTIKSFILFFALPLLSMFLIGKSSAVLQLPNDFLSLTAMISKHVEGGHIGSGFFLGFGLSFLLGSICISFLILRRGRKVTPLGDVDALIPRNSGELGWAALLSLNAGLSEEVYFRLFVPLLLTSATGQPLYAFIAATVLFGLVHFYQGWLGIVATTAMGAIFCLVYLGVQSLAAVIVLHILIDLNGLVLRPWLRLRRSSR